MKIVASEGVTALPHDIFGDKVMQDVKALHGGAVTKRGKHFQSPDEAVIAAVHKGETLVTVHGLGLQPNAARWTAMKAFAAKGGVALGRLATEVPGLVAHNEWRGRRRQADDVITAAVKAEYVELGEALITDTSLSEDEFVRRTDALLKEEDAELGRRIAETRQDGFYVVTGIGTENDPGELFFRGAMHHERQTLGATSPEALLEAQAASEGFFAATEHGPKYSDTPHTHSQFVAKADDLLAAATRMSAEYDALVFHADDPGVAVARALGAQNLDHLTETWQGAMQQNTPLAAGQFVMRALAQ